MVYPPESQSILQQTCRSSIALGHYSPQPFRDLDLSVFISSRGIGTLSRRAFCNIMAFIDKRPADMTALRVTFSRRVTVVTTDQVKVYPREPSAGEIPSGR